MEKGDVRTGLKFIEKTICAVNVFKCARRKRVVRNNLRVRAIARLQATIVDFIGPMRLAVSTCLDWGVNDHF